MRSPAFDEEIGGECHARTSFFVRSNRDFSGGGVDSGFHAGAGNHVCHGSYTLGRGTRWNRLNAWNRRRRPDSRGRCGGTGFSALLAASAKAFLAVKYVGAIYLGYLGVRAILTAGRKSNIPAIRTQGGRKVFFEGILTEALNVKTALFFLAFIPQFVDHELPLGPQFAVLGLVCVCFNTSVRRSGGVAGLPFSLGISGARQSLRGT